jgi:serine/threonine protein kinase
MPTATLPQIWRGRSGREYVPAEQARVRHGGMAIVRKVIGRGGPVGQSGIGDGVPVALKLWTESDDQSLDQLQAEAAVLVEVSQGGGELPCPRLYDLVGTPLVTGIVMEWCPADLERWWKDKLREVDSFGRLMATMAEVCRRVADYHVYYAQKKGLDAAHGDLKPSNILLSQDGRWLISDFGAARVRPPDDNPLVTSKVVAGTENFLSPEALFHAKKRHAAAMDTWALAATVFSLLRLQRMVLDNSPVPRNGTQSPRFRMQRINQIHEVYGRDPTRFAGRDLDPEAFPDPLRMPEEDRRAVRECLRGVFSREAGPRTTSTPEADDGRENELARELLEVFDRALAIDPKHRYTDARDLAAAFEKLTRAYIELASPTAPPPAVPPVVEPLPASHEVNETEDRARELEDEVAKLKSKIMDLQTALTFAEEPPTQQLKRQPTEPSTQVRRVQPAPAPAPIVVGPPGWWSFALLLTVVFQGLTLVLIVVLGVVMIVRG